MFKLFVALAAFTALAADYNIQQWRAVEITLTSSATYADPFQDVDVTATFTGPGGITITRPAFWDGGLIWRVRFAPTQTGLWNMATSATDAANSGLHNITKTVQCDAYSGNLDIFKHGFLKVSGNGRYFTYADGTPFFYLGDTHWILPHERFDTSNVPGVASQFKYVVDKRVAQGFTVFQSEPLWCGHTGSDEEASANLGDGLTSSDLPGFLQLDRKYKYVADLGLVHANAEIGWVGNPAGNPIYTETYMARLAKYWAARYGAYPVIWTIAQEVDENFFGAYNATTINKWYAVAQSLRDNDGYRHIIMPHMETGKMPGGDWPTKSFHDAFGAQLGDGEMKASWFEVSFWNDFHKPAVVYEGKYDNLGIDSRGALGAAYKAFLNGMYGYGYGANGVWNDMYSKPGEPADIGANYGSYFWWYNGANLETGNQLTYFRNFMTSLAWWKLVPRFEGMNSPYLGGYGFFMDSTRVVLATDEQKTYVAFFFGEGNATGRLENMLSFSYNATWFNPRNGLYTDIGSFLPDNGKWTIPSRPTSDDWVLLVQGSDNDSSIHVSPPGDLAFGKTVTASSTLENSNWGIQNIVNGTPKSTPGDLGYTSDAQVTVNHTEWVIIDLDTARMIDNIVLFGRTDAGWVGNCFPIDFTIQLSTDSIQWNTVVTRTGYPMPDTSAQSFTFDAQNARYIKVRGTNLSTALGQYRMQFAEIEVYGYLGTIVEERGLKLPLCYGITAFPNPFTQSTLIRFGVPNYKSGEKEKVSIRIYDLNGRLLQSLAQGSFAAGYHTVNLSYNENGNGRTLGNGIYFCRMQAPGFTRTLKLLLVQ